jgi:hypothetical protein
MWVPALDTTKRCFVKLQSAESVNAGEVAWQAGDSKLRPLLQSDIERGVLE